MNGHGLDAAATLAWRRTPLARTRRLALDLGTELVDAAGAGASTGRSRRLDARVVVLAPGALDLRVLVPDPSGWVGLLILDGLIMVRLDAGRAHTGWLVGGDDLVVPWTFGEISLTASSHWRVLAPTRVAMLDRGFSACVGGDPALLASLVAHAARTTNWLLAKSLVMACPGVEERLLLLFALYGERWGVVRRDGILLKLPLTHRLLATLCGVRRPSVTLALRSLQAAGVLAGISSGAWLLSHDAAAEVSSRHSCWTQYSDALGLSNGHG